MIREMRRLLAAGVDETAILFVRFEDDRSTPLDASGLAALVDAFYATYPQNHGRSCHLFLDEIQCVTGWSAFKDGWEAAGRAYDKAPYGAEGREAAQAFILHSAGSWIDGKLLGGGSWALAKLRGPDWDRQPPPTPPATPAERAQAQAQAAAARDKEFSENARKSRQFDDMIEAHREAMIERDHQEQRAQEQRAVDLYIHGPH